MQADIVIVGAGISGAVLAERYAARGKKVLVLEKREHIGGNCFDFLNVAGIRVSKYGAHIFHTNDAGVWQYVNQFSAWREYRHHVVARVGSQVVSIPVNRDTVNQLLHTQLHTTAEMQTWLEANRVHLDHSPQTSEEAALSQVGRELYTLLYQPYTQKQWAKDPAELDASVLQRIPVYLGIEKDYFLDTYQGMPALGYTKLFENILCNQNISVVLNTDYFTVLPSLRYQKLFFTGPIDQYFQFFQQNLGRLEYRSLRFEEQTLDQPDFQGHPVVNEPSLDVPYTRTVEYKHLTGQQSPQTTIVREYSSAVGEPYYPVPSPKNTELYERYKVEAKKLTNVYFVGRLANYKYFNMDQAFRNALNIFAELED